MNRAVLTAASTAALACLSVATAPRTAAADALAPVAPAPIARVTPAGPGVAVLRDGTSWLLDDEGRAGARCPGDGRAPHRGHRPDGTARAAEEVLREVGMSDEDESPDAEELLEDEGPLPLIRRPAVTRARASLALDLASTAGSVWIGADDGVWRLDAGTSRCARAGLEGRAVQHVAVGGAVVVAVSDATVWRVGDGGAFEVAAVLPSRVRAAAVAEDGTIFLADEDGVARIGAARAVVRVVEGVVEALAACGPVVYALTGDAVYRLNGADVESVGPPPPARALACAGPGLIAAGVGLWTSPDGGTWTEEDVGRGRAFIDVALAAGHLWLATGEGLFVPVPEADEALFSDGPLPRPRRPVVPVPLWAALRPRLSVVFDDWTESQGRAGWRLWVSLTVSLDRHALGRLVQAPEVDR